MVNIFKDDGSISMNDIWKFWMPSENQFKYFSDVLSLYKRIEEHNVLNRRRRR